MAGRIRAFISVSRNARPTESDHRHKAGHGTSALDGSIDLRRCRLRQNRGRDSRRVQSGDGRQTSRRARANDRAGATAFRNVPATHARLSGANRNAQPLSFAGRTAQGSGTSCAAAVSTLSSARIASSPATSFSRISAWSSSMKNSASAFCTKRNSRSYSNSWTCSHFRPRRFRARFISRSSA